MNFEEAYSILLQATGALNASRDAHVKMQQALDTMRQLFEAKNKILAKGEEKTK